MCMAWKLAATLGVLHPLAVAAGITIVYGSVRALFQDELKKRLAYSTVSQVSYIVLGAAILGPVATIGGLVASGASGHHEDHALLLRGELRRDARHASRERDERRGPADAADDDGVHRGGPGHDRRAAARRLRQQVVPAEGRDPGRRRVVALVLGASSLLNAAYFLPILYRAWFNAPPEHWPAEHRVGTWDTHWMLLLPPLVTAGVGRHLRAVFAEPWSSPLRGELIPPRKTRHERIRHFESCSCIGRPDRRWPAWCRLSRRGEGPRRAPRRWRWCRCCCCRRGRCGAEPSFPLWASTPSWASTRSGASSWVSLSGAVTSGLGRARAVAEDLDRLSTRSPPPAMGRNSALILAERRSHVRRPGPRHGAGIRRIGVASRATLGRASTGEPRPCHAAKALIFTGLRPSSSG